MPLLLVMLVALIASAINAFAGGGTFLTFPALTGLAGLSEKVANMTSTLGIWPGTAASVVAARSDFRRIPRSILIGYGLTSLIGGGLGSVLLLVTSAQTFRLVVPWLLAAATIIFACSKPIARWAGRQHGDRSLKWTLFVGFIQFFIAVYGGYFGAGIGVLMLAGLSFAGLEDIRQMNALKVLLGMIINGLASIVFMFGPIDWHYALSMAAAATVGGFLGMKLARRAPQSALRGIILAIGVLLTGIYFYKAYGAG
jgi:uncharacterized membrane protein YfcA